MGCGYTAINCHYIFHREAVFVTSLLLNWWTKSFQNGVYSLRNEFALKGENAFLLRVDSIEKGGKMKELLLLKLYPNFLCRDLHHPCLLLQTLARNISYRAKSTPLRVE